MNDMTLLTEANSSRQPTDSSTNYNNFETRRLFFMKAFGRLGHFNSRNRKSPVCFQKPFRMFNTNVQAVSIVMRWTFRWLLGMWRALGRSCGHSNKSEFIVHYLGTMSATKAAHSTSVWAPSYAIPWTTLMRHESS